MRIKESLKSEVDDIVATGCATEINDIVNELISRGWPEGLRLVDPEGLSLILLINGFKMNRKYDANGKLVKIVISL